MYGQVTGTRWDPRKGYLSASPAVSAKRTEVIFQTCRSVVICNPLGPLGAGIPEICHLSGSHPRGKQGERMSLPVLSIEGTDKKTFRTCNGTPEGGYLPKASDASAFRRYLYRRASLLKVEFLNFLLYSSSRIFSSVYPLSFARVMADSKGVRIPSTVRMSRFSRYL